MGLVTRHSPRKRMNTATSLTASQIRQLLLCLDDASPLMGLRSAQDCLEHLLGYFELPETVRLQLQACQAHMSQAELHVRMAATGAGA
jgi:hypothetical protein